MKELIEKIASDLINAPVSFSEADLYDLANYGIAIYIAKNALAHIQAYFTTNRLNSINYLDDSFANITSRRCFCKYNYKAHRGGY